MFAFLLVIACLVLFLYLLIYTDLLWGSERRRYSIDEHFESERLASFPPATPNGWYCIGASKQLKPKQIKEINALGLRLVLFRGESGQLGVLDAFCPHLGTNLIGGSVQKDQLICPFHGWQFDNTGQCKEISYSDQSCEQFKTASWPVVETQGLIYLWHHQDAQPPSWDIGAELENLSGLELRRTKQKELHIHMQDFFENGADYAHFPVVHNHLSFPLIGKYFKLKHQTKINFGKLEQSHLAYFQNTVFVKKWRSDDVHQGSKGVGNVVFTGPSIMVFKLETSLASPVIVKTFLPQTDLKLLMTDYIYAPRGSFDPFVQLVVKEACLQFDDDISIWERKRYRIKPKLVRGDGPIMSVRRWYSQFYTSRN